MPQTDGRDGVFIDLHALFHRFPLGSQVKLLQVAPMSSKTRLISGRAMAAARLAATVHRAMLVLVAGTSSCGRW